MHAKLKTIGHPHGSFIDDSKMSAALSCLQGCIPCVSRRVGTQQSDAGRLAGYQQAVMDE